MQITAVQVHDFRNFQKASVSLGPQANLIFGPNASGKTNLLEAVQFGCTGSTARTNHVADIVRWGKDIARVVIDASVAKRQDTIRIELVQPRTGRRRVTVNGARRSTDEGTGVAAVTFSPEHLKVVKESPDFRRDFLDEGVGQLRPRFLSVKRGLSAVLKQRNALLKSIAAGGRGLGETAAGSLASWDEQLAHKTAEMLAHRLWFLEKLRPAAGEHFRRLAGGGPDTPVLYLGYQSRSLEDACAGGEERDGLVARLAGGDPSAREAVAQATLRVIRRLRDAEVARGLTLVGPQRDDLTITAGDVSLREFGSQGEQRTAALAIKLGELEAMRVELGEWPVLLLDDVMSELDEVRRGALVDAISTGPQTLITSTNPGYFQSGTLEEAHVIEVRDGGVRESGRHA